MTEEIEYIRMPRKNFEKLLKDLTDIIVQQQQFIFNHLQADFSKNKNEAGTDPRPPASF